MWVLTVIMFTVFAAAALGVVAFVVAWPIVNHVDVFTVLWTVAGALGLLAAAGAFFEPSEPWAFFAVGAGWLAALLAVVALLGGAWTPTSFCTKHDCISNFDSGQGSIVQCGDGMWSHSGGLPGACSYHGGER